VEFIKPNEFFLIRTKWGEFIIPNGLSGAKGALIKKSPDERRGIEQYFKTIARVGKVWRVILLSQISLLKRLYKIFWKLPLNLNKSYFGEFSLKNLKKGFNGLTKEGPNQNFYYLDFILRVPISRKP